MSERPQIIEPLREITDRTLHSNGGSLWRDVEIEKRQALRETGQVTSESMDEEMAYAGDELRRTAIVTALAAQRDFAPGDPDAEIEREYAEKAREMADGVEYWTGIIVQAYPSRDYLSKMNKAVGKGRIRESYEPVGSEQQELATKLADIEIEIRRAEEIIEFNEKTRINYDDHEGEKWDNPDSLLGTYITTSLTTMRHEIARQRYFDESYHRPDYFHLDDEDTVRRIAILTNPNSTMTDIRAVIDEFNNEKYADARGIVQHYQPILEAIRSGEASTYQSS